MAWFGATYVLTGSAVQLSAILNAADSTFPLTGQHIKELSLQAAVANANPFYAGKSNVTAAPANAFVTVPPGATQIQVKIGEGHGNNPISSNDIYIVGTAAQIAFIAVVT